MLRENFDEAIKSVGNTTIGRELKFSGRLKNLMKQQDFKNNPNSSKLVRDFVDDVETEGKERFSIGRYHVGKCSDIVELLDAYLIYKNMNRS